MSGGFQYSSSVSFPIGGSGGGGGGGAPQWKAPVGNYAALAAITTDADGTIRVVLDENQPYQWDATTSTWVKISASEVLSTSSIDTSLTGTQILYTVPAGKKAVVTSVIFLPTSVTGTGTAPRISVGTNSAAFDNIMSNTFLTGLDSTTEVFRYLPDGNYVAAASASQITAKVNNAAGFALQVSVKLIGFLV